ncbi:l-ascorbate oxidase-like protein [Hordeum vulgare]|nr:l-ascorbate oxidase-like protein [Hordeum vulgare]
MRDVLERSDCGRNWWGHLVSEQGLAGQVSPSFVGGVAHARAQVWGQGRRSATPALPSSPVLGGHSDVTVLEFFVELHVVPRGHLRLPHPFARAMEAAKPPILWLRVYGCSHGAMQVHVEYPKHRSMLLGRGWKAFAHAHNLEDGHILRFKQAEDNMLSLKFYGHSGVCLGCCEESSSGAECPSSSDSDEEDSGGSGDLGRSGSRGVRSEYNSVRSDRLQALPQRPARASPLPDRVTLLELESVPRVGGGGTSPSSNFSSPPCLGHITGAGDGSPAPGRGALASSGSFIPSDALPSGIKPEGVGRCLPGLVPFSSAQCWSRGSQP